MPVRVSSAPHPPTSSVAAALPSLLSMPPTRLAPVLRSAAHVTLPSVLSVPFVASSSPRTRVVNPPNPSLRPTTHREIVRARGSIGGVTNRDGRPPLHPTNGLRRNEFPSCSTTGWPMRVLRDARLRVRFICKRSSYCRATLLSASLQRSSSPLQSFGVLSLRREIYPRRRR